MTTFWEDVVTALGFIGAYLVGISGLVVLLGASMFVSVALSPWWLFATVPLGLGLTAVTFAAAARIVDWLN